MATIRKKDILGRYNRKQTTVYGDSTEINYSASKLKESYDSFSILKRYDIFLSHSYDDARIIKQIKEMLEEKGYSVYVDWIEDSRKLQRSNVSKESASLLRQRMENCNSLLYITSESAEKSVWMPWELGFMDAKTSRVAVAPILDEDADFSGREYLGLYPYLDLTNDSFYIHSSIHEWIIFPDWMSGGKPVRH